MGGRWASSPSLPRQHRVLGASGRHLEPPAGSPTPAWASCRLGGKGLSVRPNLFPLGVCTSVHRRADWSWNEWGHWSAPCTYTEFAQKNSALWGRETAAPSFFLNPSEDLERHTGQAPPGYIIYKLMQNRERWDFSTGVQTSCQHPKWLQPLHAESCAVTSFPDAAHVLQGTLACRHQYTLITAGPPGVLILS